MVKMTINRFPPLEYKLAEALNTLCTNLSLAGGDIKKILITSCHPREGKSFISMNLMRAFATFGMRVLLIDGDIRNSKLQVTYDIQVQSAQKYRGLTGYLVGITSMEDIIGETDIPGAYMILSGTNAMNSFPLFNTPRLSELLDSVTPQFDLVLIDAPPVGTIIDAAKIALHADGALFIVEGGAVSISQLKSATLQIEKTGCPIIGYVMNKTDNLLQSNDYYYSYGYGTDKRSSRKHKKKRN